ncbi:TPA: tail fiber assembly protein [Providencia alcalifaciens]|nr:tail fiber assembly protein [Providencia alcalifaciens]
MTYYKNKKTGEVFAYDDGQLSQVDRLTELEGLIKDTEPKFINASNNLQQAEIELKTAHEKLADAVKNEDEESTILVLEANANVAAEKRNNALIEFNVATSKYKPLKAEYDAIPLGFFDIRENIGITQKMTSKEVDVHLNPPKSKDQYIAEAEQKKKLLIAEVNIETEMLRTKLALGRIKDDERAQLNKWMDYLELLEAVDTSLVPDIEWPQKPF